MREAATEIAAVAIPLLVELVAITFVLAVALLWCGIATGRI